MLEITGDLFSQKCDAICITTNGVVRSDGKAVMGAGIALAAAKKYPWLPDILGNCLTAFGNEVHFLTQDKYPCTAMQIGIGNRPICIIDSTVRLNYDILSLPTKHNWRDNSDIVLIERSCKQLVQIADDRGWKSIVSVRPGCSNGGLNWYDVRARIAPLLDSRFSIITP